jgi:hypothetical protein
MIWLRGFAAAALTCAMACGALPAVANRGSDAIVLVQSQADQTMIMVTFSGCRVHREVRDRMARLASGFGGHLADLRITDRRPSSKRRSDGRLGAAFVHTVATAMLGDAAQLQGSGFWLQPYVGAFGDLTRWEVMFLIAHSTEMRPLRHYITPALTVTLTSDGSPYRYVFERGDPHIALPALPLTDQMPLERAPRPHPARRAPAALAGVVALASACGLAVLVALLLVARARRAHGAS